MQFNPKYRTTILQIAVICMMCLFPTKDAAAQTLLPLAPMRNLVTSEIRSLAWHPNGMLLAVGGNDGIQIYNSNLQLVNNISVSQSIVDTISWNPDGSKLAASSVVPNAIIQIWDTTNFNQLLSIPIDRTEVHAIGWSADGTKLLGSSGKEATIWDTTNGNIIVHLTGHSTAVNVVAWLNNNTAITGDGGPNATVRIWDIVAGIPINAFSLPLGESVITLAISPNKDMVAANWETGAKVWNIQTQQEVATLQGHTNVVYRLDWVGNTLISLGYDNLIIGWSTTNWSEITTLQVEGFAFDIALNPINNMIAYGGQVTIPYVTNISQSVCNTASLIIANDIVGLINAINTANTNPDASVIGLDSGTYTFTTVNNNVYNALPRITTDITICSQDGATLTRQSGAPQLRFFDVQPSGKLMLDNLTLNGASANNEPGGAVINNGTLIVNNVTFTGNHAGTGAAIDNNYSGATATITNSTFQNNTANYGAALDNDAGATMTVSDSTFTGNSAVSFGGVADNEGTLTMTNNTMTSNTASGAYGGAIRNVASLTITGGSLNNNSAQQGGAITNFATLNLSGVVMDNNQATTGSGWGGALFNSSSGTTTISASTLSNNDAIEGGAIRNHGSLTLNQGSQVTGNAATQGGGGIYNTGSLTLTNSVLSNNTAVLNGGGLLTASVSGQTIITGSTISGNSSTTGRGGGIRENQSLTITDSKIINNTAATLHGGISASSGTHIVHNSCISGNSMTSVGYTGSATQDYTGNWWGAANGPSGAGTGAGDSVTTKINFANFLTADCPQE